MEKYPCNYCGSCSVWLAAFEEGTGLDTLDAVKAQCRKMKCALVDKEVQPEDSPYAYWLHRAQHNYYIWVECSNCGFWVENYKAVVLGRGDTDLIDTKYHYCPICGKEMRVK